MKSKLILSCSEKKAPAGEFEFLEFFDLYAGPMWQQLKAAGVDRDRVAAVSALYGFLEPRTTIRTYDVVMDEKSADWFSTTGNHVYRFAHWIGGAPAIMFGGQLYRRIGEVAQREYPKLTEKLELVGGTFLEQRKRLGMEIRS